MANTIVKTMQNPNDPFHLEISVIEGIIQYLKSGEKQLGEIKKFLEENGTKYTKQGLILLLNRLIQKNLIRKHMPKRGQYQTYYLPRKIKYNIPLQARLFAIEASNVLLRKEITSHNSKKALKNLIQKIGFYTVFNYLYSWNLRKENSNSLQVEWLENTLPMRKVSFYLSDHNLWEFDNKNFESKELQKVLKILHPTEYNKCKSIISNLEETATTFVNKPRKKGSAIKIIDDL